MRVLFYTCIGLVVSFYCVVFLSSPALNIYDQSQTVLQSLKPINYEKQLKDYEEQLREMRLDAEEFSDKLESEPTIYEILR